MKKQIILVPIILALAVFAGWRVLHLAPSALKGEAHEEHGHGVSDEHGEHDEHGGHGGHKEEGRVELSAEARKNADLKIEEAGPAKVKTSVQVYGKVLPNEEAIAHVMPRFPGIVKAVKKRLGDKVQKGDVLAQVESNESLKVYDIVSELSGTVIAKDVTLGEFVKDDRTVFTVADLSSVWVDMNVYRQDFKQLREGQEVEIHAAEDEPAIAAKIAYISPFGAESTQTMLARAVIPNETGELRPGLFVTAEIITGEVDAPVAVRNAAIQRLKEKNVVFVEEGDAFEAREVTLGAKDAERVAVTSGLEAGDKYVSDNSFLLKAEIGKEEAEHEH